MLCRKGQICHQKLDNLKPNYLKQDFCYDQEKVAIQSGIIQAYQILQLQYRAKMATMQNLIRLTMFGMR